MKSDYQNSRRVLIELLRDPQDGPIDLSGLDDRQRGIAKVTSCANVLLYMICFIAGFDAAEACNGLDALQLRKKIYEICMEDMPPEKLS